MRAYCPRQCHFANHRMPFLTFSLPLSNSRKHAASHFSTSITLLHLPYHSSLISLIAIMHCNRLPPCLHRSCHLVRFLAYVTHCHTVVICLTANLVSHCYIMVESRIHNEKYSLCITSLLSKTDDSQAIIPLIISHDELQRQ
jgi:hypothetical protein